MSESDMQAARPVAMVTGASAGIGEIFAERLAERGFDLLLVARRADRLQQIAERLAKRHTVRAQAVPADLTCDADLARLGELIAATPGLELLVNNAGFGTRPLFWQADLATQDAMVRLHVLAVTHLTHAALNVMVPGGRGAVINVSSVAGFFQSPSNVVYCSTKAWLTSFTDGLDIELAGTGVRAMALCPGFTYSEFHDVMQVDRAAVPKKWWLDPHFVVDQALRDLDRGRWLSIPSLRYKLAAGLSRWMPRPLRLYFARRRHTKLRKTGVRSQM